MTVLLTLYAAAKLTSSGSTVRSTLPSWTTSGALVVDMGILPRDDAGDQRGFVGGGEALPADEGAGSQRTPRQATASTLALLVLCGHLLHF